MSVVQDKCYQYWPDQGCWMYGNVRVAVEDFTVLVDYTIRKFCIQYVSVSADVWGLDCPGAGEPESCIRKRGAFVSSKPAMPPRPPDRSPSSTSPAGLTLECRSRPSEC